MRLVDLNQFPARAEPASCGHGISTDGSMDACDCSPRGSLLALEDALAGLLAGVARRPPPAAETLPLTLATGRILASPVFAPLSLPAWDNSAMDGFALRAADVAAASPVTLPLSGRIAAGEWPVPLPRGSAARIFTGAPIPAGADTVVAQEACTWDAQSVTLRGPLRPGQHIRHVGEDVTAGQRVLEAGHRLRPADIALAASLGMDRLEVYRRPLVAIVSTGNELTAPGDMLSPGAIYASNNVLAYALVDAMGAEPMDYGTVADDPAAIADALREAAAEADLVLSSGGVSVGEADYVRDALTAHGRITHWRVAIKPGKPVAFGEIGGTPVLALPGNPAALYTTLLLFGRPLIHRLQGRTPQPMPAVPATASFVYRTPDDGRRRFLKARRDWTETGAVRISLHAQQSSGALAGMAWSNGLIDLPPGRVVVPGDSVPFIPLEALLA